MDRPQRWRDVTHSCVSRSGNGCHDSVRAIGCPKEPDAECGICRWEISGKMKNNDELMNCKATLTLYTGLSSSHCRLYEEGGLAISNERLASGLAETYVSGSAKCLNMTDGHWQTNTEKGQILSSCLFSWNRLASSSRSEPPDI